MVEFKQLGSRKPKPVCGRAYPYLPEIARVVAHSARASARARALNLLLRYSVKRRLSRIHAIDVATVLSTRARLANSARAVRMPRGVSVESCSILDTSALWVRPKSAHEGVILYLHGGAYAAGNAWLYRGLCARIALAAHASVLALDYPLAPEAPYPRALEQVCSVWRRLCEEHDPKTLAIAGDSAGGGLLLGALMKLRDEHAQLPVAALALSPWTDLTGSGASVRNNAECDPYLVSTLIHPVADHYLAGAAATTPYASPLFGEFAGLPPLAIHVGSTEILLDDSQRIATKAAAAGVGVSLKIWSDLPHVFQLFAPWIPEAQESLEALGRFALAHIGSPTFNVCNNKHSEIEVNKASS